MLKKRVAMLACILAFFFANGSSGNAQTELKEKTPLPNSTRKILVAYFSHTGHTREIAKQIHQQVGGDIYEIVPVTPYPDDYDQCVEQAKQELNSGAKPKLKSQIGKTQSYDVIFIGYPDWWGTFPAPVLTFLTQTDLAGKTIAPFCTHEGSGLGRSVRDITKLCPKSTVLEGLAVRGSYVRSAQTEVSEWLSKIGVVEKK
jgi:flavodoxin